MNKFENKIMLSTNDAYHIVAYEDILYCKSENSSTTFFLRNKEQIITSLSIGSLEPRLAKHSFIRSHQSYLVNTQHILRIRKQGASELELINQCVIPVSTRLKSSVLRFLENIERFQGGS